MLIILGFLIIIFNLNYIQIYLKILMFLLDILMIKNIKIIEVLLKQSLMIFLFSFYLEFNINHLIELLLIININLVILFIF